MPGANPIQTGMAPGTIQAKQAAVLRGKVSGRDGFPIPGVTVTVLNHPELGQTRTRPDGMFDMAVNGGGLLTVKYEKTGLLPVQRQVTVPWQAFAVAADAIMIPLDTQVTTVTANAATMQVAQGGVVTDAAGTRRATLFVPAGTSATMTLPGGGTQPLSTLSMRLTEYTVGPNFKATVPATLPPGDHNQYALELSADEAVAAGATRVTFNQPVVLYVDNFLDFSCGDPLPIGSYDTVKAVWMPEPTGVVIQILSVTGGLADVDTDGNGTADNAGLSTAERQQLAAQYAVGQKLWRIPTTHFTTKSACNTTTPPGAKTLLDDEEIGSSPLTYRGSDNKGVPFNIDPQTGHSIFTKRRFMLLSTRHSCAARLLQRWIRRHLPRGARVQLAGSGNGRARQELLRVDRRRRGPARAALRRGERSSVRVRPAGRCRRADRRRALGDPRALARSRSAAGRVGRL